MKTVLHFYLLFCVALLCSYGCQKKKWKKPAHFNCTLALNNPNTGLVQIHYGNFTVEEINFNGTRKQGEKNISFNKMFDNGISVYTEYYHPTYSASYQSYHQSYYQSYTQKNSQPNPEIIFDIPQGTYTGINFNLKLSSFSNNKSLVLNGTYTNSFGTKIPVVFTLDASVNILPFSKFTNGGNEIVFVEGKTYETKVNFDPGYWFASVSQSMLQNANLTSSGWGWGNNVMYINKTDNANIYDIVVGRIKDGNEIVFN